MTIITRSLPVAIRCDGIWCCDDCLYMRHAKWGEDFDYCRVMLYRKWDQLGRPRGESAIRSRWCIDTFGITAEDCQKTFEEGEEDGS